MRADMKKRPMNLVRVGCEMASGRAGRCGPLLVSVHKPWCYCSNIGAGADDEQDDEEEGLEVEECGLQNESHHFVF